MTNADQCRSKLWHWPQCRSKIACAFRAVNFLFLTTVYREYTLLTSRVALTFHNMEIITSKIASKILRNKLFEVHSSSSSVDLQFNELEKISFKTHDYSNKNIDLNDWSWNYLMKSTLKIQLNHRTWALFKQKIQKDFWLTASSMDHFGIKDIFVTTDMLIDRTMYMYTQSLPGGTLSEYNICCIHEYDLCISLWEREE